MKRYEFVHTEAFDRSLKAVMADDQLREIQDALCQNPEQGAVIRSTGGMMEDEKSLGQLLIGSMDEHIAYMHGEGPGTSRTLFVDAGGSVVDAPPAYDADRIRRIRRLVLHVSQTVFAEALNVSRATVRAWEQGVRQPEGATRRLLEIAEEHPEVFREKIHTTEAVPA